MKTSVKRGLMLGIVAALWIAALLLVNGIIYQNYTRSVNRTINAICVALVEQYPDISETQLMEILNSDGDSQDSFLASYGIDLQKDAIVQANQRFFHLSLWVELAILMMGLATLLGILLLFRRAERREVAEIADYVEQINRGNYALKIDNNSEDELSILKNEVYKTTIMLREVAEGQREEKLRLKDSLSDISHQLKTPITALIINLENLRDNPEISMETRARLVQSALREVNAIKALVQVLLTLSKLDANTIAFNRQPTKLVQLVQEAYAQVEALADLKGIQMELPKEPEGEKLQAGGNTPGRDILCDSYWQAQGLANVLKNAIEHAASTVWVSLECNAVYQAIHIRNDGPAITEKDMRHVFERFYKGEGASRESVGIGLAMAKAICEKDHATILVDIVEGCTEFTIKYIQTSEISFGLA